ncbi:MAG: two-component sensor histidine kinase [Paucibacter sp.]|nr:two-component sensor histidine kinase [Roseateles sp.]
MDGSQGRVSDSIQRKLSLTLLLAILVMAVIAGLISFKLAFDDACNLQDDMLRQLAALASRHHLTPEDADTAIRPDHEESRVIVQRLEARSPIPLDEGGVLPLPPTLADGLQTLEVNGETFRVLVKTLADGTRIAVAQEESLRNHIALANANRTVLPFLVLVPVLLLIVAHLLRTMFRPIAALSSEVAQREESDLHPIEDRYVPSEVRPFVVAINLLLAKVAHAMEAQRRFVADAAHELRSPLTALSLQAERLAEAPLPETARERVATLRRGIERSRKLLDQLLTLARVQSLLDRPDAQVSTRAVFRGVLEDLMPLAEAKLIDLGVEEGPDLLLAVGEFDLTAIVKNLVDNAIRYTPPGGRVDLSAFLDAQEAVLRVQDNGPGIPPDERERVFDPFYRRLGTEQLGAGLGLSIVKAVAERIGARVTLAYADEQRMTGLRVSLHLPLDKVRTAPD